MADEPTRSSPGMNPEPLRRKRLRRYEIPGDGRYLTFSCRHRLPLFSNDLIKELFVRRIDIVRESHQFRLLAWVIMPEHIHMLVLPDLPAHPISSVLRALKRPFAERVIHR